MQSTAAPAHPSGLDPTAHSPLYQQLVQRLEQGIRTGVYRPDQALPPERSLGAMFGVSRVTARKALDVLVAQGRVVRRHGAGNFVASRLAQSLTRVSGFSEELLQRGLRPTSRWLAREVRAGSAQACEQLGLPPAARVAHLERLRLADGVPVAYETSALPLTAMPKPAALQGSLYAHLVALGQAPVRAQQHIRALNADAQLAQHLALPVGSALLWVVRTAFQAAGAPVEFTVAYCRSDYYGFVVELGSSE